MKKVTLQDIANELNTSKNTVSKALRGLPGVSDRLRQRIIKYANEMGYVNNSLKKSQIDDQINVTMVCRKDFFTQPSFWSQVFYGIMECSGRNNVSIKTITVNSENEGSSFSTLISSGASCDGFLVVGTISDDLLTKVKKMHLPMVVVDYYNNDIECDYVNSANSRGIYKTIRYLIQNNHKRIGFISNREGAYSFNQRYEAYLKYMKTFLLPVKEEYVWLDAVYSDTKYYTEKLRELYDQPDFPTAWICVNDNTALAFHNALRKMNIKVPDDVSLVGFDNVTSVFSPFLTTINVPQKEMGERAMEQLIFRIKNPDEPFVSIQINTTLIERSSVKRYEVE
ncbi:MAG TPA: LacI family transcriptional regulator [Clostridiales bacterium]|nr:LacI family transcriptional regulator [Clostridiales bacterium]